MSGTQLGGYKAAAKNKANSPHGENHYRVIGALGGKASKGGAFSKDRELARRAGSIGGKRSRRRSG